MLRSLSSVKRRRRNDQISKAVRSGLFRVESLETRTLLSTGPVLESINRLEPDNSVAGPVPLTFRATFSEPVFGVDPSDFRVVASGGATASPTVSIVAQSGSIYDVTVSGVTGPGAVGLDLVNDRSIHDGAGQTLIGAGDTVNFSAPISLPVADGGTFIAAGNFLGGDGRDGIAVTTGNGDIADTFVPDGHGGFLGPKPLASPLVPSANPDSILSADFNGDGIDDLIVGRSDDGKTYLYPSTGPWQFGSPTAIYTGSPLAVGDFNHDGKMDLAVTDPSDTSVSILLGSGSGTFTVGNTYDFGTQVASASVGDLNNDGYPDLVVTDSTGNLHVMTNDGHGGFAVSTITLPGPSGTVIAIADVDRDGRPDIVASSLSLQGGIYSTSLDVLHNNGDGTFYLVVSPGLQGVIPDVAADFNGDGLPDLLGGGVDGVGLTLITNIGNDMFAGSQPIAPPAGSLPLVQPDEVVVGDFNGDGIPDIATTWITEASAVQEPPSVILGGSSSFVGQSYTILPPVRVTAISRETPAAATTSAGSVTYHVQFSTAVKDIDPADFNVTTTGTVKSGTISVSASQGSAVDVTVSGVHGNGTLQLSLVDNNTITDLSGNPLGTGQPFGGSFSGQTYTITQTLPRVIGINREAPLSPAIGDQPVTYQVLFNESVTGVDSSDFQVVATGNVSYVNPLVIHGSGQIYTVTINGISGGGSVTLDLKDNGSIHDALGNQLANADNSASFDAATVSPISEPLLEVAVADMNGDGSPDRISISADSIYVELGNGDGTFGPPTRTLSSFPLTAFAIEYFNNDGNLDVATVGPAGVFLFPGLGDGRLGAPIGSPADVYTPVEIHATDFNADGNVDLLITTYFQNDVILFGDGKGRFTASPTLINAGPAVTIGDINGDGFPDIDGSLGSFVNDGHGNFSPAASTSPIRSTQKYPTSAVIELADLNGDGIPDQVTVDGDALTVNVAFGQPDGTFGPITPYVVGSSASQIVLADVNNDGWIDITAIDSAGVTTLLNKGNGTFSTPETMTPGLQTSPLHVTTADFNGDGRADLIVSGSQQTDQFGIDFYGVIEVYLANPDGTYTPAGVVSTGDYDVNSVTVADINGDGIPDVIATDSSMDSLLICLGTADGQLIQQAPDSEIDGAVAVADFNGDGKPDIFVASGPFGAEISDGNGDGTFQPPVPLPNAPGGYHVFVADVNGDGKPDLVTDGLSVDVALGNGNDTFQPATHIISTAYPYSLQAKTADMNGDGIPDLIVANSQTPNDISIYLGNGDGTFAAPRTFFTGDTTSFDIGDVNGDGIPDVVTSKDATFVSLGNGDGTLAAPTQYAPAGVITIGDANGDGKADIIFAHRARYNSGGSFTPNVSGIGVIFNTASGDFVGDTYRIVQTSDSISGTSGNDFITLTQDPDHIHVDWQLGSTYGQMAINDPAGLAINGNGGVDQIYLNYAYGNPLPLKTVLNGQFYIDNFQTTDNLSNRTIDIGRSQVYITYSSAATDPINAAHAGTCIPATTVVSGMVLPRAVQDRFSPARRLVIPRGLAGLVTATRMSRILSRASRRIRSS